MVLSSLGDVSQRAENMSTKSLKLMLPCPSSENVSTILSLNGFSCHRHSRERVGVSGIDRAAGAARRYSLQQKRYLQLRHGDDERQGHFDVGVVGVVQGHQMRRQLSVPSVQTADDRLSDRSHLCKLTQLEAWQNACRPSVLEMTVNSANYSNKAVCQFNEPNWQGPSDKQQSRTDKSIFSDWKHINPSLTAINPTSTSLLNNRTSALTEHSSSWEGNMDKKQSKRTCSYQHQDLSLHFRNKWCLNSYCVDADSALVV